MSSPTIGTTVHSQRVDCSVTTGQLSASIAALGGALSSAGLPVSLVSDWDALHRVASGGHDPVTLTLDGVALFTAGCSHTNILNNRDAISQVANDIRKILTAAAPPLLGLPWATYQAGFGHVAPKHVFNGGDPTGAFTISWDNWGGPTADGHGTALWVGPKDIVADGHREPARFRAYDLGTCNGKKVYLHMAVWFPQHGQTFDPATNGETTYTFCPAHASPQTVTVTGNDGRRYTATVVAQDQIRDCAANAHGSQLITFLTAHPCGRGAWRRLFTINLAGRTVALSSISLLEPGLTKPGQPPQPYIYAEQLRALELAPGTGGINDLLQAGVRPVGWPAQIPLNEAFDVLEEDAGLAILDAWYLNGETSPSAPELRSLEDALFPTALTTTSP